MVDSAVHHVGHTPHHHDGRQHFSVQFHVVLVLQKGGKPNSDKFLATLLTQIFHTLGHRF